MLNKIDFWREVETSPADLSMVRIKYGENNRGGRMKFRGLKQKQFKEWADFMLQDEEQE